MSICAVVVTYNRKDLLLRNIESLLAQKHSLDILIYDNASTDNTFEYLESKNILKNPAVIYIQGKKNTGGAGGFRFGAEEAVKRGYDYVWLMDDDGYCINEFTLSNIVKCISENKPNVIFNAYVTYDISTLDPTFGYVNSYKRTDIVWKSTNGLVEGGSPYNGTLIPVSCFKEIGYNDDKFFIYGDENDFYYRSKEAGYKWYTVIDSLYYHPVNRNILKLVKIGRSNIEIKDQPIWKLYLEIRNGEVNAIRHYRKRKRRFSSYIRVVITSIYSKDKRLKRMKYGFLALKDARNNKFDRPLMFGE